MPFDLASAKPVEDAPATGFDLASAKPVEPLAANDTHIANDLLYALPDYARGMNYVATTALKGLSLATATLPMAIDKAFGTQLADKWFSMTTAPLDKIKEQMGTRPDAGFVGKATHMTGELVGMLMGMQLGAPKYVASAATELWPTISGMIEYGTGMAAAPALSSAIEAGQKVYEHTNDGTAAFSAAKAAYLSLTGNVILPLHAGGGVAERAITSFAAGVTTTELSRQYTNANMPLDMRTPASFEDALLSGLMMAGLGVMGPRGNPGMVKPKEIKDAAIVIAEGDQAAADHITGKLATVMEKTGIKPSQVAADAMADPTIKADLTAPGLSVDSTPQAKAADAATAQVEAARPIADAISDRRVSDALAPKVINPFDGEKRLYASRQDNGKWSPVYSDGTPITEAPEFASGGAATNWLSKHAKEFQTGDIRSGQDRRANPAARAEYAAQARLAQESTDTGIPRAYIPIAREMMVKDALFGTQHDLNIAAVMDNPYGKITSEKAPNHINYRYVESPEDVKAVHARISEVFEQQIEAARGKESWDATQAKAMEIIKNSGLKPNGGDFKNLAGRAMAWEAMAQKAAFDVAEAARNVRAKGAEATPEDVKAQILAIENLAFLQAVDQGNGAEIARALNARKAAKQMNAIAMQTKNLFAQYGHDPQELARMIGEMNTKEGMAKFAAEATKASTWEKLVEGWKAGLVSGPVTHLANIMGNTTFAVLRVPIDALAATIGTLRGAAIGDRLSMYEPLARVAGILEGAKNGLKIGAAMMAKEDAMVGKAESFRHAIEGKKGEIIRLPFRALGAEDAVFKAMNESGETFSLASRQAIIEGLNPQTREFRQRIVELMQNPTPEMIQQIFDAGQRFTFNADLGEKGHAVQVFVKKWHLEFVVPFIRTPGNIAKELIRMTPMAPFIKEWRDAIAKGGIEGDRAMAEVMLGSAVMSTVFAYALNGNISGAGDPDPAKRRVMMAAGWQPYSIKIGGTWYNYQRLQPLGTLIGMAADIANVWEHMNDGESDQVPKMLSVAFANAITSQTFLQGITNLVNALSDPTRFGPRLVQQFAASTIPNFVAQPTAMYDPFVRETDSILQAVQARIPGQRDKLLPKLDVFGEPLKSKERLGVISPITETEVSKDKVRMEAARLGVGVSLAPKSISLPAMNQMDIGKVALTQQQQNLFTSISGKLAHEILTPIVNSPTWDSVPDMMKKTVYDKVFTKAREVARSQVIPPEQMSTEMQRIADALTLELNKIGTNK